MNEGKHFWPLTFSMFAMGLSLIVAALAAGPVPSHAQDEEDSEVQVFKIDSAHSTILFKIKHMGLTYVYGTFANYSGEVHYARENPADSKVVFAVQADSVDTNVDARDKHLRNADFFNVSEHPEITFSSTKVEKTGEGVFEVTGELSLMGTKKELTTTFNRMGEGKGPRGDYRIGGQTSFVVTPLDYGMDIGPNLGPTVEVTVAVEGILQGGE